jgi:hypothetical protein
MGSEILCPFLLESSEESLKGVQIGLNGEQTGFC